MPIYNSPKNIYPFYCEIWEKYRHYLNRKIKDDNLKMRICTKVPKINKYNFPLWQNTQLDS